MILIVFDMSSCLLGNNTHRRTPCGWSFSLAFAIVIRKRIRHFVIDSSCQCRIYVTHRTIKGSIGDYQQLESSFFSHESGTEKYHLFSTDLNRVTRIATLNMSDPSTLANLGEVKTKHLSLDWTISFEKRNISGHVLLDMVTIAPKVSKVVLDTSYLDIHKVLLDGAELEVSLA